MLRYDDNFILRFATPKDHNFIINSWCSQIRKTVRFKDVGDAEFREYCNFLEDLVHNHDAYIACDKSDPNIILFWMLADKSDTYDLLFCYTKGPFRNYGLFKFVFKKFFADKNKKVNCMYWTKSCDNLADKYNLIHNPALELKVNKMLYNGSYAK